MMARDRHVTVTEVATALGFVELGRFSVEYRKAFGESPSETLRQAFREHGGCPERALILGRERAARRSNLDPKADMNESLNHP